MVEVFKIQRSLGGNTATAFIRNEPKTKLLHVPIETVVGLFSGQELMVYWLGTVTPEGNFEAIRKASHKPW
jgi:hypothetical protein